MKNLQETFNELQTLKQEQKSLKSLIKEGLNRNPDYPYLIEKIKSLKEQKSQIENQAYQEYKAELSTLDSLKLNITELQTLLSDIALSETLNGHTVELQDKYNVLYEPQFKVNFKKTNTLKTPEIGLE